MKRLFAKALILVVALSCPVSLASDDKTSGQPKWRPASYNGLILGKSTRADVRRIFGEPKTTYHPEDERDNPVKSLFAHSYEGGGGFQGRTEIIMLRRNWIVIEVALYPPYKHPISLDEAIQKYGKDYIERGSKLGPCPTAQEIREYQARSAREWDYPAFYVYPSKGMYIHVNYEKKVQDIAFMQRCS